MARLLGLPQNAVNRTHPVGQLKPNDLGLFDTLGNAHEWLQDPFRQYTVSAADRAIDDVEIITKYEDRFDGVLRGGSFEHVLADTRSAHRYSVALRTMRRAITTFGFRVARTCR
jgi:sulfatase modifying factor 1